MDDFIKSTTHVDRIEVPVLEDDPLLGGRLREHVEEAALLAEQVELGALPPLVVAGHEAERLHQEVGAHKVLDRVPRVALRVALLEKSGTNYKVILSPMWPEVDFSKEKLVLSS